MTRKRLSEIFNPAYLPYWTSKPLYRAMKGSKGSGKSKVAALWHIWMMSLYPQANTLVIKKVYSSMKDSVFQELLWAIDTLGFSDEWTSSKSPLELRRKFIDPVTGRKSEQKILFKGMDNALKLASINVYPGHLCWVWFEEAADLTNEEEFDRLMMSIRGQLPPESGLWISCTLSFNPWSEHLWLKSRFFDTPRDDTLTLTTTYKDNRFLSAVDIARYEDMYIRNPRAARVICDGEWGIAEGLIFNNWEILDFDIDELKQNNPNLRISFGMDFGFTAPSAFEACAFDFEREILYVFDEMYQEKMLNNHIAKRLVEMGYGLETIVADCAEPKSIYELQQGYTEYEFDESGALLLDESGTPISHKYAIPNIVPAMKGSDSLRNGIRALQMFKIYIHPKCEGLILEARNYCYSMNKDGEYVDDPIDDFNHGWDAVRYARERFFAKGKGRLYEAKGKESTTPVPARKKIKSKRVFSTR